MQAFLDIKKTKKIDLAQKYKPTMTKVQKKEIKTYNFFKSNVVIYIY